MIFAVFDLSPVTVCVTAVFLTFILNINLTFPDCSIDELKPGVNFFLLFRDLWQNTCQWILSRICHWASRDMQTVIVSTCKSNLWSKLPQLQIYHNHCSVSAVASQLLRFYISQFTVNACEKCQGMAQHKVRHCTGRNARDLRMFVVRSWATATKCTGLNGEVAPLL